MSSTLDRDAQAPRSSQPGERTKGHDPAWEALMNAPPLRSPLTEEEKRAIEDWKERRAARKTRGA